ncbi:MAG: MazG nucleotide pyrophosphohydrolase domain-containing protein [Arachnia sp.]
MPSSELQRLREVMARLRVECPWDAAQTHESLLPHLIEEAGEVVDAVETGGDADLEEELGDLLLQVFFHARIAEDEGRFDVEDVARGIADKLVRRHPYVFEGAERPDDLRATWEQRKRAEKGRSSSLEGIAEALSVVARAQKVVSRSRSHGVDVGLPDAPIDAETVGESIVDVVARAQASGIDADAAARAALRALEARIRAAEASSAS